MKIGIFLGYGPRQLDPHQGISRLITFIIKGAIQSPDTKVLIAGSGWIREGIYEILDDAGIPRSAVQIVTTRGEPPALRIFEAIKGIRNRPRRPRDKLRLAERFIIRTTEIVADWLATTNIIVFAAGVAVLFFIALALAVPVLVAMVFVLLALLGRRAVRRALSMGTRGIFRRAGRLLRNSIRDAGPTERIRARELYRVVKMANRQKDISVWYVPSMFWPEVSRLRGKVVMGAPDIVFYEFPLQFRDESARRALKRISGSVAAADRLICYSEHVKQKHLVEMNDVPPGRVSVIRHGIVDMRGTEDFGRDDALSVLHSYIEKKHYQLLPYLRGFRFDDVEFLFYSSQPRPYKNIEGLTRVFERILREHYRPIKLILTGNILANQRVSRLVESRGLEKDVISLPNVPNNVLGALYKLSALSVTPTQFEGGFPFTFSEAYSVGTPSVMSRIPVVTEIVKDERLLEAMTFLPEDREDMVRKILWGLDNRDELLRLQAPLYEELSKRTWRSVAGEYLDVMREVASG
ncbi:glycosyltransferase [Chelativorans sp. AA-79]|uniref:glycosyltransferase n=1 Tax=Chelativorans sp. AA-79 TaxID=3028735 RepID=UPI0023F69B45|nr:glycosyltransferase [Chelativorans sp. AA-79]WEX10268.1 glycosyltransferase [Chelativorans sp. AA-79]